MSKDKHRSLNRRLRLLEWSADGGILFHREGGMAMADHDIKRLVRDGLIRFARQKWRGHCLSPKKFIGNFRRDFGHRDEHAPREYTHAFGCRPHYIGQGYNLGGALHGGVNITRGLITDAGQAFLERKGRARNLNGSSRD